MKSLSKREKIMLLMLGMVLFVYLYYSVIYIPIKRRIETSKFNISKYIQDINDTKASKKQFELQTMEWENIKVKYEEAKMILPQMEMNPEIVYNIQKFFQGSGVEVTSITIGVPEELKNQKIKTEAIGNIQNNTDSSNSNKDNQIIQEESGKLLIVPVTIELSGDSYEQVMKFLSLFENDRRFVEITNFAITVNRPVTTTTMPQVTAKSENIGEQSGYKEVEVIAIGEGEGYKEIPEADDNTLDTVEKPGEIKQPEQDNNGPEDTKPGIEVDITARYYYMNSSTEE